MSTRFIKTLSGLLTLLLLACAGCGKKAPAVPQSLDIQGVKVDLPKLQAEFSTAAPELQSDVNQASSGLRYGQYEKALMSLDHLVNNPALSEPQKKAVTEVIEQMKQLIAKAGPVRQ